jgi:hypothetical protein
MLLRTFRKRYTYYSIGPFLNILKKFCVSQVGGMIILIAVHDKKHSLSFDRIIKQVELTSNQEEKAKWMSRNFLSRVFSMLKQHTEMQYA